MATANLSLLISVSLILGACASTPQKGAEEASTAEPSNTAAEEPNQEGPGEMSSKESKERCAPGKGRICWKETMHPTAQDLDMAKEHRQQAAKQRATSEPLMKAETRACVGISEEDRDMSPFAHKADIARTTKLYQTSAMGYGKRIKRFVGATVVFRAVPGMTAEWLQRVVDCHIARNAALGNDMSEMPYCPLVPRGVKARVRSVGNGFAVDISSNDSKSADEVWRRAEQLSPVH